MLREVYEGKLQRAAVAGVQARRRRGRPRARCGGHARRVRPGEEARRARQAAAASLTHGYAPPDSPPIQALVAASVAHEKEAAAVRAAATQQVREAAAARDEALSKGRKDVEAARDRGRRGHAGAARKPARRARGGAGGGAREPRARRGGPPRVLWSPHSRQPGSRCVRGWEWEAGVAGGCLTPRLRPPLLAQWAREVEDLRARARVARGGLKADGRCPARGRRSPTQRRAPPRSSSRTRRRCAARRRRPADKVARAADRAKAEGGGGPRPRPTSASRTPWPRWRRRSGTRPRSSRLCRPSAPPTSRACRCARSDALRPLHFSCK